MSKKEDSLQPLSEDSLGDLSIEELEARLELQIVHPPESQICYDCSSHTKCGSYDETESPGDGGGTGLE